MSSIFLFPTDAAAYDNKQTKGTSIIIAGVSKDHIPQANRTSMQRVSCVCLPKSAKKQAEPIRFGAYCQSNRTWAACCKASAGLKPKARSCKGTRVKDWAQVIIRSSNKTNVRVILGKPSNVTKTSNGTASTAVTATKTAVKIAPLNKTTSGHCLKGACAANFVFSIYGDLQAAYASEASFMDVINKCLNYSFGKVSSSSPTFVVSESLGHASHSGCIKPINQTSFEAYCALTGFRSTVDAQSYSMKLSNLTSSRALAKCMNTSPTWKVSNFTLVGLVVRTPVCTNQTQRSLRSSNPSRKLLAHRGNHRRALLLSSSYEKMGRQNFGRSLLNRHNAPAVRVILFGGAPKPITTGTSVTSANGRYSFSLGGLNDVSKLEDIGVISTATDINGNLQEDRPRFGLAAQFIRGAENIGESQRPPYSAYLSYDGALSIRDRFGGLVMQSQPPGGEGPYALALSDNGDLVLINGAPGGQDATLQRLNNWPSGDLVPNIVEYRDYSAAPDGGTEASGTTGGANTQGGVKVDISGDGTVDEVLNIYPEDQQPVTYSEVDIFADPETLPEGSNVVIGEDSTSTSTTLMSADGSPVVSVVVDDPNDFFLTDRNGDAIVPGEGTNIQSVESQSSTDSPFGGLPLEIDVNPNGDIVIPINGDQATGNVIVVDVGNPGASADTQPDEVTGYTWRGAGGGAGSAFGGESDLEGAVYFRERSNAFSGSNDLETPVNYGSDADRGNVEPYDFESAGIFGDFEFI